MAQFPHVVQSLELSQVPPPLEDETLDEDEVTCPPLDVLDELDEEVRGSVGSMVPVLIGLPPPVPPPYQSSSPRPWAQPVEARVESTIRASVETLAEAEQSMEVLPCSPRGPLKK
jgi:hypothetical protein